MPDTIEIEKAEFVTLTGVSYETLHRLERYAELLREWNERINLVAESTLPHIWTRHFLDSAQLLAHIPQEAESLADLGSGAGFPGLVLAILDLQEQSRLRDNGGKHLQIKLIESTGKKADFLQVVIDELQLHATVYRERIEALTDFKADIVTARALKPLPELLKLVAPLMKEDSTGLFLKGRNLQDELTESAKGWTFAQEKRVSLSDPSGNVLIIRNLQAKHAAPRKSSKRKKR